LKTFSLTYCVFEHTKETTMATTTADRLNWTGTDTRGARASAFARLVATDHDWSATVARLALGAVMLPHGAQKLLGWFGGYGFHGTMGFLTGAAHLPWVVALLVILAESLGSLALVLGFAGRFMAAGITAVMVGAIATVHAANGFFMNWNGTAKGEGFEYHILAIALALVVMLKGSGAASVDRALTRRQ
jgi:putative oxidoreductase